MTKEKPSGWTAPQHLKGFSIHCCKNSQISLAFHQRRVFNLLSDGIPRTIADISADLRLSDPRSVIRDLRHKGVVVSDFWVNRSTAVAISDILSSRASPVLQEGGRNE